MLQVGGGAPFWGKGRNLRLQVGIRGGAQRCKFAEAAQPKALSCWKGRNLRLLFGGMGGAYGWGLLGKGCSLRLQVEGKGRSLRLQVEGKGWSLRLQVERKGRSLRL